MVVTEGGDEEVEGYLPTWCCRSVPTRGRSRCAEGYGASRMEVGHYCKHMV